MSTAAFSEELDDAMRRRTALRKRRVELEGQVDIAKKLARMERESRNSVTGPPSPQGSPAAPAPSQQERTGKRRSATVDTKVDPMHRPRSTHGMPGMSYYAAFKDIQARLKNSMMRASSKRAALAEHPTHVLRALVKEKESEEALMIAELEWLSAERAKIQAESTAAQEASFQRDLEVERMILNLEDEIGQLEDSLAVQTVSGQSTISAKISGRARGAVTFEGGSLSLVAAFFSPDDPGSIKGGGKSARLDLGFEVDPECHQGVHVVVLASAKRSFFSSIREDRNLKRRGSRLVLGAGPDAATAAMGSGDGAGSKGKGGGGGGAGAVAGPVTKGRGGVVPRPGDGLLVNFVDTDSVALVGGWDAVAVADPGLSRVTVDGDPGLAPADYAKEVEWDTAGQSADAAIGAKELEAAMSAGGPQVRAAAGGADAPASSSDAPAGAPAGAPASASADAPARDPNAPATPKKGGYDPTETLGAGGGGGAPAEPSVSSGTLDGLVHTALTNAAVREVLICTYWVYASAGGIGDETGASLSLVETLLAAARRLPHSLGCRGGSEEMSISEVEMTRKEVLVPALSRAATVLAEVVAGAHTTLHPAVLMHIARNGCTALRTVGLDDEAAALSDASLAVLSGLPGAADDWDGFAQRRERVRPSTSPLNDWSSVDIAEQLTLVAHGLFRAIDTRELLKTAWTSKDAQRRAPRVRRMIAFFNATSRWVSIEIVEGTTIKTRRNAIAKFVRIATQLRALNNIDSLFAVLAGISSVSVHRLKRTWETVPSKVTEKHTELRSVMESRGNFATLRAIVDAAHSSGVPCIPYLGYMLTQLTFVEDGNPSKTDRDWINFVKHRRAAGIIRTLQEFQRRRFVINPDHTIVNFLRSAGDRMTDDDVHKLSLLREPRQRRG